MLSTDHDGNLIHLKTMDLVFLEEPLQERFEFLVPIIPDLVGLLTIQMAVRLQDGVKAHHTVVVDKFLDDPVGDKGVEGFVDCSQRNRGVGLFDIFIHPLRRRVIVGLLNGLIDHHPLMGEL